MFFSLVLSVCWIAGPSADPVFYRSKTIPSETLAKQEQQATITDDKGDMVRVELFVDAETSYIYWYRRLFTEVCLTGECRPIDIGIYWTAAGKYAGVEIFNENLTKTDHSDFSDFDYRKLETVLNDEWSALREFEFDDLVENKKEGVDATTGATKKVIAEASVKDAVYTTYTMWHLIHVGDGEQIALLSYDYLNTHPLLLSASLEEDNSEYSHFLIQGLTSGKLKLTQELTTLVLNSLNHSDGTLKNAAFHVISSLPLEDDTIQRGISRAYQNWGIADKNRFLQTIARISVLNESLYAALAKDLDQSNPWFLNSMLPILSKHKKQSQEVIKKVKELAKSENTTIKTAAEKFLSHISSR